MGRKHGLDFFGINALSAGSDHVIDASDQIDVAVLAQHADSPVKYQPLRSFSAVASGRLR